MSMFSWLRRTVLAVTAVCALSPASAMTLAQEYCPQLPMRIVVIGDSLADGLWGSLHRAYARCEFAETVRLTVVSDGLAKTSAEGWLSRYAKAGTELDTREADVVIVQIGANDITTIRNGNTRESFSTEEWNALYSDRVKMLARGLKKRASKVFWFGLPVVGNTDFEGPYQVISQIQRAAVLKSGGEFIDIHDLTKFGTQSFAMNGTFDGRLRQMRASDKVHFTRVGYDFVAREVIDDLVRFTQERERRARLRY